MLKPGSKSILILAAVFIFCTCIDPYTPKLTGYTSLLVVDGLITDANNSYSVRLSRTFQAETAETVKVPDAIVYITDESRNQTDLKYRGNGIYKTDSTGFRGIVGKTYILHIITPEGGEYESEAGLMQSVPDIDSIYIERDQELINNGTGTQAGARIYLDSKEGDGNEYYRWSYNETWKFKVPLPQKFNYINDTTILAVPKIKDYCWKNKKSDDILIHSVYSGQSGPIKKEPITFIAPDKSDRFNLQYSILVSQYSISKKEYDFWNNMKEVNENGGDIFARQPFTVISNIHNINDPKERVLGYFQVSAVKQKRKTLSFSEIQSLKLPFYNYPCDRIESEPHDWETEWGPKVTWDQVYSIYCITSTYAFVEPKFKPYTNQLDKLVFTSRECANCELTGVSAKPDFWVDLN
jgi:hypothetical protein